MFWGLIYRHVCIPKVINIHTNVHQVRPTSTLHQYKTISRTFTVYLPTYFDILILLSRSINSFAIRHCKYHNPLETWTNIPLYINTYFLWITQNDRDLLQLLNLYVFIPNLYWYLIHVVITTIILQKFENVSTRMFNLGNPHFIGQTNIIYIVV